MPIGFIGRSKPPSGDKRPCEPAPAISKPKSRKGSAMWLRLASFNSIRPLTRKYCTKLARKRARRQPMTVAVSLPCPQSSARVRSPSRERRKLRPLGIFTANHVWSLGERPPWKTSARSEQSDNPTAVPKYRNASPVILILRHRDFERFHAAGPGELQHSFLAGLNNLSVHPVAPPAIGVQQQASIYATLS